MIPAMQELTLFYKIINDTLPIFIPSRYQRAQSCTRRYHPNHFILPQATLNTYKFSFYPKDWNELPTNIINLTTIANYKIV